MSRKLHRYMWRRLRIDHPLNTAAQRMTAAHGVRGLNSRHFSTRIFPAVRAVRMVGRCTADYCKCSAQSVHTTASADLSFELVGSLCDQCAIHIRCVQSRSGTTVRMS
jgi:hypothetical protein